MISNVDARSVFLNLHCNSSESIGLTPHHFEEGGHKMRGKQPVQYAIAFPGQIIKKHDSKNLPFPRNRDKEIQFQKSMNNISCLSAPLPHADVPCRPATGKNGRESDLDHLLSNTSHPQPSTIHSTNQIGIDSSGYICGQAALSRGALWCLVAEGNSTSSSRICCTHGALSLYNIGWPRVQQHQKQKYNTDHGAEYVWLCSRRLRQSQECSFPHE